MISVIELTLNDYAVTFYFDLLSVGNYRNSKMLGNLGSNLCSITIDSLTAATHIYGRTKRGGITPPRKKFSSVPTPHHWPSSLSMPCTSSAVITIS